MAFERPRNANGRYRLHQPNWPPTQAMALSLNAALMAAALPKAWMQGAVVRHSLVGRAVDRLLDGGSDVMWIIGTLQMTRYERFKRKATRETAAPGFNTYSVRQCRRFARHPQQDTS